jgi:hypothetical protein
MRSCAPGSDARTNDHGSAPRGGARIGRIGAGSDRHVVESPHGPWRSAR